jgi:hypothetical protein
MANPQPIPVIATHELRDRSTTVPPGTPGEITEMTGSCPTYYTVSFRLNGSDDRVTMDHLSRLDIHEA